MNSLAYYLTSIKIWRWSSANR